MEPIQEKFHELSGNIYMFLNNIKHNRDEFKRNPEDLKEEFVNLKRYYNFLNNL